VYKLAASIADVKVETVGNTQAEVKANALVDFYCLVSNAIF